MFEQTGNRDNKLRARMKWVVQNLGFDEVQRRILNVRKFLVASLDAGPAASPRSCRSWATPPPGGPPT